MMKPKKKKKKCVVLVKRLPVGVNIDLDESVQYPKKSDEGIAHQHSTCEPSQATVLEKAQNH
jgi:hypothetical protein